MAALNVLTSSSILLKGASRTRPLTLAPTSFSVSRLSRVSREARVLVAMAVPREWPQSRMCRPLELSG